MLLLLAELTAIPEHAEQVETLLRELTAAAEREPGTLYYAINRSLDQPNRFIVYELYRDRAACDAHLNSEPLQAALRQFQHWLAIPPQLSFCQPLAATPHR